MKTFVILGLSLLMATQLHAETYSWIDDSGTYNFTEDYSSVPKKYRKRVKRRDDIPQETAPQAPPTPDKTDVKSSAETGGDKQLYDGKSRAEWRRELELQEADLNVIAQRMELLRKQIYDPKGIAKVQFEVLKKEYDDNLATYNQKYSKYTELIEMIRKAGIVVEMKKK